MSTVFEQKIHDLNFTFVTKEGEGGVILTDNYESNELISPDILFALEVAKTKFNADAVYFRFFEDGRASVPQLYIFDYTYKTLTKEVKNDIHIKMWSGYQVPAYIIIEKSSVSIFDSREKPRQEKESYAKEIIKLTGESLKKFRSKSFDDGLFWEEHGDKHFKFEQSAARDLIKGLKSVFKSFREKSGLDRHVALKLIVQSLLIKYLEERDEKSESGYFAGTYFKKNFNCENFCDTIRKGKLLDLLDQLATDFNGKIFDWDVEYEKDARTAIRKSNVVLLADYLDAKIQDSQYILWRLYSFSHLPVEIISSVYEELLTDSKDVVYTPEMIVSTLIDECMPLKNPQIDFKLIDVSCGSGIFLVKAYKRIIQWWRYEQWKKTGELIKPPLPVLKELLLNSIYGIDIQSDAVRLAVFSLSLAILDEVNLDPPTWGKLRFPDLSENVVTKDFFEFITKTEGNQFDLVIGNPPFNLPPIRGKEPDRKKYFKELSSKGGYKSQIAIPDENPALHFLVKSLHLLKSDGILCMIQPSGPLLYQSSVFFKTNLFSKYNLLQVIDFTKLADKLWGKKSVATAAVFLQNKMPDNEPVLHLVASRTVTNINRLFLEFDFYDCHFIDKEAVLSNLYVWKANLLGGGRLLQLIERLSSLPTLKSFLQNKERFNNWKYGEGYTVGNRKYHADYIHKKTCVNPKHFKEDGIEQFTIEYESHFEAPRERAKDIYTHPHILIKENIGENNIPIAFLDQDAVFSHEIVGIHSPQEDIDDLKKVYKSLVQYNILYRFYILATSNRVLIGRATAILKKDIDNIPFPEDLSLLSTSFAEDILINDVLTYQLNTSRNSLLFHNTATIQQMFIYSNIFISVLNTIYKIKEEQFRLYKILNIGPYYALHFEYTNKNIVPKIETVVSLEQYVNEVIEDKEKNYRFKKIIKSYAENRVVLVKPKQVRYWLPSIALRDADEAFADYIRVRYQNA